MTDNEAFAAKMRAKREVRRTPITLWLLFLVALASIAVIYTVMMLHSAREDLTDVIRQRDDALKAGNVAEAKAKASLDALIDKTKRAKACDLTVKADMAFQKYLGGSLEGCRAMLASCVAQP